MKVAFVLALTLAFASAGKDPKKGDVIQSIVGGTSATPHSYPWMAIIAYRSGRLACGGSLIEGNDPNNYYILTAAHCVSTRRWRRTIRLGDHNVVTNEGTEQEIKITHRNVIRHPNYNQNTLENDVALIRIPKSSVDITDEVQVGTLSASDVTGGDSVTVIGWGTLSEGGFLSATLQEVQVTVQSHGTCANAYSPWYFQDSMFCAGPLSGGQDACQGDSGGPIMINRGSGLEIVGVVSWGFGCARANYPGVYADVYNLRDFINSNIN